MKHSTFFNRFLPVFVAAFVTASLSPVAMAQQAINPKHLQVSISRDVALTKNTNKVTLNLRDADLRDVLNMLSKQGGFNLVLDNSVKGTISVDITNITLNKALEHIFNLMCLNYVKDGNTVIVASRGTMDKLGLSIQALKTIPVKYQNADSLSNIINNTIFKVPRPGGSTTAVAGADLVNNCVVIMGSDRDVAIATQTIQKLDYPRQRKVYYIRHTKPITVAKIVAANFFDQSVMNFNGNMSGIDASERSDSASSGSTASTASASSASSSTASSSSSSTTTAASSSSSAASSGSSSPTTASSAEAETMSAGGVTFIAEPVSSTLTVMGTTEQLELVDSIIAQVDIRKPQVTIEIALVEISRSDNKRQETELDILNMGQAQVVFPNANIPYTKFLWNKTNTPENAFRGDNRFGKASVLFDIKERRGKILANPTVLAMDGTESKIDITEEVATFSSTSTVSGSGPAQVTTAVTKQAVGVVVTVTPTIMNDGSVTLNLKPVVTQIVGTATGGTGGAPTTTPLLASRSLTLNAVRAQDGETLVFGGLLQETQVEEWRKIPGLSNLPLVGAMFRSTQGDTGVGKTRSELVLMVTPHILKEDAVPYFTQPADINSYTPQLLGGGRR